MIAVLCMDIARSTSNKYLPNLHGLREVLKKNEGRSATAMTDAFIMTENTETVCKKAKGKIAHNADIRHRRVILNGEKHGNIDKNPN